MGSVLSPLSDAEFQRMMADEVAVETPSKEEELQQLMSTALSEFRLGRPEGLPKFHHLWRYLRGWASRRLPWRQSHHLIEKERPYPPRQAVLWGINPAREGGSGGFLWSRC